MTKINEIHIFPPMCVNCGKRMKVIEDTSKIVKFQCINKCTEAVIYKNRNC